MSGHIRAKNAHKALKKVTNILRDKYNIYHTTIQIEKSHPGVEIACCDNDEKHVHHHVFDKLEEAAPHEHENRVSLGKKVFKQEDKSEHEQKHVHTHDHHQAHDHKHGEHHHEEHYHHDHDNNHDHDHGHDHGNEHHDH